MPELQPIILYDIPSQLPGKWKPWSPNTWNTRYALNFTGLPYKTEWVEYPDIKPHCDKIGASYSEIKPSGEPYYSLPIIHDPNTNQTIVDSFKIALYLERQYPDTPKLFPVPNSESLIFGFDIGLGRILAGPFYPTLVAGVCNILNEKSAVYFRETREKRYTPKTLEEVSYGSGKDSEEYKQLWDNVEKGLNEMSDRLDLSVSEGGKLGPYVMGETLSYADFMIAAVFMWARRAWAGPQIVKDGVLEEEKVDADRSEEWDRVCAMNGGRWKRYAELFAKYETVV